MGSKYSGKGWGTSGVRDKSNIISIDRKKLGRDILEGGFYDNVRLGSMAPSQRKLMLRRLRAKNWENK